MFSTTSIPFQINLAQAEVKMAKLKLNLTKIKLNFIKYKISFIFVKLSLKFTILTSACAELIKNYKEIWKYDSIFLLGNRKIRLRKFIVNGRKFDFSEFLGKNYECFSSILETTGKLENSHYYRQFGLQFWPDKINCI